nr:MAG TPA: hypothetical protein [Caudoviricetes sp.]
MFIRYSYLCITLIICIYFYIIYFLKIKTFPTRGKEN